MPAVVPPSSISSLDEELSDRLPATVRRPAAIAPPGRSVPRLDSVPAPTSTVPDPLITPCAELVKPPAFSKTAAEATCSRPCCVTVDASTVSLPASTRTVPVSVFVKLEASSRCAVVPALTSVPRLVMTAVPDDLPMGLAALPLRVSVAPVSLTRVLVRLVVSPDPRWT